MFFQGGVMQQVVQVRSRVSEALGAISQNGWLEGIKSCSDPMARLRRLRELVPDMNDWTYSTTRQFFFLLHREHGVDLGVCQHLIVDAHTQRCRIGGTTPYGFSECTCPIPVQFCVARGDECPSGVLGPTDLPFLIQGVVQ